MKFLVIDDSSVDKKLLISLLGQLGHQAETAETTDNVTERITTGGYDALFLDIVMPDQDGYKFLRSLRGNAETAQQYVIFYSSKKTPIEINYGIKRAGADDYLVKPATKESLSEVINKIK
jgi:two-component system chemotaxis response regulator CheY